MVQYKLDPAAFREEVLNADWMVAHVKSVAERAAGIAKETAPFDEGDPDGRHYRDGFHVDSGTHGGVHGDRAWAELVNDDVTDGGYPVALAVEFGTRHNPAHHTMRDAMRAAAGE